MAILIMTSFLNLVQIDKLVVPEVADTSSDVTLDCQYTVADDNFTLKWFFNNSLVPVYEWSPYKEPKVFGILNELLDLKYHVSEKSHEERRALRILNVTPELSGNYTCVIENHGAIARKTKFMLVYSVEHDFELQTKWHPTTNIIEISCIARGVFPLPEITIEYNYIMVSAQHLRMWRTNDGLYDAVCYAETPARSQSDRATVVCRLSLPQVDYTAMKKKIIFTGGVNTNNSGISMSKLNPMRLFIAIILSIKLML